MSTPIWKKVLVLAERRHVKGQPVRCATLIVEDDGTQDGGGIIGVIEDHGVALEVCKAMNWKVTYNEFNAQ